MSVCARISLSLWVGCFATIVLRKHEIVLCYFDKRGLTTHTGL